MGQSEQLRRHRGRRLAAYLPSVFWGTLLTAALCAGTWLFYERDLGRIGKRQLIHLAMILIFVGPSLIGLVRSLHLGSRHLKPGR